ncbi:hypothetical protein BBJ28_00011394 [Nothophytophthora sp. Chile5]|nr:hypothetical protein BBJ28_00011394 [Nothophytophthora sp. Chile5]
MGGSTYISPVDQRDARTAPSTKPKYESCRNDIKGWINDNFEKDEEEHNRDSKRFLDTSEEIIGAQITPAYFDEFLARKCTLNTTKKPAPRIRNELQAGELFTIGMSFISLK